MQAAHLAPQRVRLGLGRGGWCGGFRSRLLAVPSSVLAGVAPLLRAADVAVVNDFFPSTALPALAGPDGFDVITSIAAEHLEVSLGITPAIFGLLSGAFFIGYFIFEVPSNMLLRKFGARKWITRIVFSWGILAAATAFVDSAQSLLIVRVQTIQKMAHAVALRAEVVDVHLVRRADQRRAVPRAAGWPEAGPLRQARRWRERHGAARRVQRRLGHRPADAGRRLRR